MAGAGGDGGCDGWGDGDASSVGVETRGIGAAAGEIRGAAAGAGARGDGTEEAADAKDGVPDALGADGTRGAVDARTVCGSARTASVSVFRIASSSASRSRVMSASAIGGLALRSWFRSACRARS